MKKKCNSLSVGGGNISYSAGLILSIEEFHLQYRSRRNCLELSEAIEPTEKKMPGEYSAR